MIFSEVSSRAIFEMDNVELIELRKTSIQCPSCLHHVLEGTTTRICGKLPRPNKNVTNRIKEAFEALKAPCCRTSRQNDEVYRTSQLVHSWRGAWIRYLDFIVHFDISHNAPSWQRGRYVNLIHLRNLDSNHYGSDLGMRKNSCKSSKKQKDREFLTSQWILELVKTTNLILQHKNT